MIVNTLKNITFDSLLRNENLISAIRLGIIDKDSYEDKFIGCIEEEIKEIEKIVTCAKRYK